MPRLLALLLVLTAASRGDASYPAVNQDAGLDAVADDAGGADAGKAAACASTFGSELTAAFGRLDGTVLAVVGPADTQCAMPNSDHLVVQATMHGAAYRMVVNVLSSGADTNVYLAEVDAPLAGGAFEEGWHPGYALDYVSTLGVHSDAFTPYPMAELAALVTDAIELGAPISVYATSSGGSYSHSAHLVHRNDPNADGAIVLRPDTGTPRYLLFRFGDQAF
ncbi:MAG: hypothetical protein HY906_09215 [Deltaproteobacteria bacterium]|nr:hypothetical protein [Deltaproteobacteria bacterium]